MVQQLDINGTPVRLIFGMHFSEHFSTDALGNLKEDGTLNIPTSKFIANIIWFGYLNWCEIKDEPVILARPDIYEWVEMAYSDNDKDRLDQLDKIVEAYQGSSYGKGIQKKADEVEAKKKLNGETLEVSLSE